MQNFDSMFKEFLKSKKRRNSNGTYKSYKKDIKWLKQALNYLGISDQNGIHENFFDDLTDYMLDFSSKKNSKINSTISTMITVLRFFKIPYPRRYKLKDDTTHFKWLNDKEYEALRKYINSMDITKENNLSLALSIFLSLDTGVRLSELLDIKCKNVDLETNTIFLEHTKNGESRYCFINNLSRHLVVKAMSFKNEYLLWNYIKDKPLTKYSIFHFYDRLNRDLKFKNNIHLHRLRKTYATRLMHKGMSLPIISKLLGHKDIKQTIIYLEMDKYILKREYDKYYPY